MARGDTTYRAYRPSPSGSPHVLFLFAYDADNVGGASLSVVSAIDTERPGLEKIRFDAAAAAREPALLLDFFDDPSLFGEGRLLILTGVGETHRKLIEEFFSRASRATGQDVAVVVSNGLRSKSALLDAARAHPAVQTISCEPTTLARDDISSMLTAHGVEAGGADVLDAIGSALSSMDAGSARPFVEQLALYADSDGVVGIDGVAACAPAHSDVERLDDVLSSLLSGEPSALLGVYRSQAAFGGDGVGFQLAIGRALADLAGALGGGRPLWRHKSALASARRRISNLSQRTTDAQRALFDLELRTRTTKALEPIELERLCVRIGRLFD